MIEEMIRYTATVDPKLKHMLQSFKWWLRNVLGSDYSSSITNQTGVKYVYVNTDSNEVDIKMKLAKQADINKVCGFEQLSCSISVTNESEGPDEIMFSYENWMGASDYDGPIGDYRRYLINHEVLHCRPFHLKHPDAKKLSEICSKKGGVLPVMYQQSRGLLGKCTYNSWPLAKELN